MKITDEQLKEARKILAQQGGNALKSKMPDDYYKKIGKAGAIKRWSKKKSDTIDKDSTQTDEQQNS